MPLAAFPKCFLKALCIDRTMTPEEWIDLAATHLEIDGLELYWAFLPHDAPRHLEALRRQAEGHGLRIAMLCYSPDFTQPEREAWMAEIERARWAVEVAALLGAETCRVLSGQARPGLDVTMGLRLAAQAIQELFPTAERFQVKLALENHYKDGFWQYPELAWQQERFLELLSLIPPSPWFGVNYDPSNALLAGDDPIALLDQVKHRVISMHASDRYLEGGSLAELRRLAYSPQQGYAPFLRHGVIGQGMNDYDKIFSLLSSVGFRGWVSIEDGEDAEQGIAHLKQSAQFLREKMAKYHLP